MIFGEIKLLSSSGFKQFRKSSRFEYKSVRIHLPCEGARSTPSEEEERTFRPPSSESVKSQRKLLVAFVDGRKHLDPLEKTAAPLYSLQDATS